MFYIAKWETTPQNRNIAEWDVVVSTGKTPLYPILKTKNWVEKYWEDYSNFIWGLDKKWNREKKEIEVLFIDSDIKIPEITIEENEGLIDLYWEQYESLGELIYRK